MLGDFLVKVNCPQYVNLRLVVTKALNIIDPASNACSKTWSQNMWFTTAGYFTSEEV